MSSLKEFITVRHFY